MVGRVSRVCRERQGERDSSYMYVCVYIVTQPRVPRQPGRAGRAARRHPRGRPAWLPALGGWCVHAHQHRRRCGHARRRRHFGIQMSLSDRRTVTFGSARCRAPCDHRGGGGLGCAHQLRERRRVIWVVARGATARALWSLQREAAKALARRESGLSRPLAHAWRLGLRAATFVCQRTPGRC